MLSEFCPDICLLADIAVALQCLRMGKINVITYKYVIKQNI
jgi:ABC-type iron transport system FetAB ATPase subunit